MQPRPLIQINYDNSDTNIQLAGWCREKAIFQSCDPDLNDYIIVLPHPKHTLVGGEDIDSFTEECPEPLKSTLCDIYEERVDQMQTEKWTSSFDLENDFGFILVSFSN